MSLTKKKEILILFFLRRKRKEKEKMKTVYYSQNLIYIKSISRLSFRLPFQCGGGGVTFIMKTFTSRGFTFTKNYGAYVGRRHK